MGRPEVLEKQFRGVSAALLPFLLTPGTSDILINGTETLFVEVAGRLCERASPFSTQAALFELMERMMMPTGRRLDAIRPFMDGCLTDGSRFHIILPPLAPSGPLISIRLFVPPAPLQLSDFGSPALVRWLQAQVSVRKNILLAGGTGVGKTSLLGCLIEAVPPGERLVMIEETGELCPRHPHALSLEARPASPEGVGAVTLGTLVRNALRMRPDRLVLGECRGPEALDLLRALNTGHRGSFCTLHADSARGALARIESLVLEANGRLPLRLVREWIGSAVDWVIHLRRRGESREIAEILEILGVEGEVYRHRPVPLSSLQ